MGKKKLKKSKAGSTERRAGKLPRGDMQFAVIREMQGGSRMSALCEDGNNRMIRIPGKLKRRMWCRVNDIILIKGSFGLAMRHLVLGLRHLSIDKTSNEEAKSNAI